MKKIYNKPVVLSYNLVDIVGKPALSSFGKGFKKGVMGVNGQQIINIKEINKTEDL